MKKLIQLCLALFLATSALAQDGRRPIFNAQNTEKVLRAYDWKALAQQHPFPHSEVVSMDGMSVLKIQNDTTAPLLISLLTITNSSLIKKIGLISCDIKYEDVYDNKRLSFIPDNGGSFNRDLWSQPVNWFGWDTWNAGDLGLFSYIPPDVLGGDGITNQEYIPFAGTSNWRRCWLDINRPPPPSNQPLVTRLELILYLPGKGTVYLRPIKLLAYNAPFTHRANWWSPQLAALIGGIGGSLLGCCGALLGCLVSMGKARRLVLAMTRIFIVLGILSAIAGVVAAVCKQPYAVWYPLVLIGGALTFVFSVNLYPIKRRYDDLEIRRMTSMDATGR